MDVVIDDHLLLQILLGQEPETLRAPGARVFTTGLWYHRLCRAISLPSVVGVLSRALGEVEQIVGAAAVQAMTRLPEYIGLISFRELSWPMAEMMGSCGPLNLLSLEALTAADQLAAEICLAEGDINRPLIEAAARGGVPTRIL
jgi:hypothetical protein